VTDERDVQIELLKAAELQFRLASAVPLATSCERQPFDLPDVWTYGRHTVDYKEVALTTKQADFAAWLLQRTATYMMAMQIREAIVAVITDPKNDARPQVRAAYQISRLIRNAFAHEPFDPIWSIDADCRDQVFEVKGILRLDTHSLHGSHFDWRHYGGPLALFRLSQFVRSKILREGTSGDSSDAPPPELEYYQ